MSTAHPTRHRQLGVGMLSLIVLTMLSLIVVNPVSVSLAADKPVTKKIAGKADVFYGKAVTTANAGVKDVRVDLYHHVKVRRGGKLVTLTKSDAVAFTDSKGSYRKQVTALKSGTYYVKFSVLKGKKRIASKPVALKVTPGRAFNVSVKVVERGSFAFFPVGTY